VREGVHGRVRIVLPEALRELAGGRAAVEVAASATAAGGASGPVADDRRTVGGTLGALRASHPGLYDRLMTEQGALRPHVNIFVDGENIRFTGGLGTAVGAGSEILVLPAISGG
jgi:molybdopterin converting factor small subunit